MSAAKPKLATLNSNIYRQPFYGILNADGDFWTPLTFESSEAADEYLRSWVERSGARFARMLTTHKVVPVNIRLTQLAEEVPE